MQIEASARAYLRDKAPLFSSLDRPALIHSDAVLPNILIDEQELRYVDWEWAEFGDPARDLAYIGGRIGVEPWCWTLSPNEIAQMLEYYAGLAGVDYDLLSGRRDAWEVFERFTSGLYFMSERDSNRDRASNGRYTLAVESVLRGLSNWIL